MGKAKNADELADIIAGQLDVLTGESVTDEEVHVADAVANQIGKGLKLAALRIAYADYQKSGGVTIETLEGRKE
jgi:hypothetical protein